MKKILLIGCSVLTLTACNNTRKGDKDPQVVATDETAMQENTDDEWEELFNGENLEGWKAYNNDSISSQWQVEDGAIAFTPAEGESSGSENLITEEEYGDFKMTFEWKISEGGNSGVMWTVQEDEQYSEPYYTGPEIQILDNERHPDAKNGTDRTAGALYDLISPSEDATNPVGEWNEETIYINHEENLGWVELNGTKVVEFPLHGEEWDQLVQDSKFSEWEGFGANRSGHIALQDHGDKVWFRNIKIKEL